MMFELRDYQSDGIDAIREGLLMYNSVAIEHATGLGKTVIFCRVASDHYSYSSSNRRVMVVCPQITLVAQAARKILDETGLMPAIEQADQWSDETEFNRSPFVVASKQSLCSKNKNGTARYERFENIGLLVLDEAHYCATESYAEMIRYFGENGAKMLFVSATLQRHDKRALGQLIDAIVDTYPIQDAIYDGWLVPIKPVAMQIKSLDLSSVKTSQTFMGRDFNSKELNEKLEDTQVLYEIAEAVAQETLGKKTAIFCTSVDEAQAVSELLVDQYEIKSDWICSDKKRCTEEHRQDALASFTKPGGITHLCNVGILTTGWNYKALECLVMARPTQSKPLYTQILGRITRPLDGIVDFPDSTPELRRERIANSNKPYGRIIDLVDNSIRHKLITSSDVLGGRWSLVSDDVIICRFCEAQFSSQVELTMHVARSHAEECVGAQSKDPKELKEEEDRIHEKLRRQRAAVKAEATFKNVEVDPFGGRASSGRKISQRTMATAKQLGYLWVLGLKDYDQYPITKAKATSMIGQFKMGASARQVLKSLQESLQKSLQK